MDFNDHDLNDFQNRIKVYSKSKLKKSHKTVEKKKEKVTEKKIENFCVKVESKKHLVEKVQPGRAKEFFCKMMGRHKRK